MSLARAKGMLLDASAGGYAVGAFNVTSLPQMRGVVEAAVERKAPLILQTSVTPSKSMGRHVLVALYRSLAAAAPVPISLQLDHCTDADWCEQEDLSEADILVTCLGDPGGVKGVLLRGSLGSARHPFAGVVHARHLVEHFTAGGPGKRA